jgi:peptidoglycan/LPS O-acetylase OafA/YrhL
LLRLALALFALGLLAIVVIFAIPLLTDGEPGLWLYFGAMLAPLGFVLAVVFALRSGRRSR